MSDLNKNQIDLYQQFITVAPLLPPRPQEIQIPLRPTENRLSPTSVEVLPNLKIWFDRPKDVFNFKQELDRAEKDKTYQTSGTNKDETAVPKDLQKAALIAEKVSGVPHSLLLNFIRLESGFNPESKNLAGSSASGYAHFMRDTLYAQLADLNGQPAYKDNATEKLLKSIIPEDIPIAYSAYNRNGQLSGTRLTLLSPEKVEALPADKKEALFKQDTVLTNLSSQKALQHCALIEQTEDIQLTNEIHEGLNKDPLIASLLMARFIDDIRKKLEKSGAPATEANIYGMYQQGDAAGLKQAILTKDTPNAPAWKMFGDDEKEVLAKYGSKMKDNKPYFYNEDGTFKTLQQAQDYIAHEKDLSTKTLQPFKPDPTISKGILSGDVNIQYTPADSTLRSNLNELSNNSRQILDLQNSLNKERVATIQNPAPPKSSTT